MVGDAGFEPAKKGFTGFPVVACNVSFIAHHGTRGTCVCKHKLRIYGQRSEEKPVRNCAGFWGCAELCGGVILCGIVRNAPQNAPGCPQKRP